MLRLRTYPVRTQDSYPGSENKNKPPRREENKNTQTLRGGPLVAMSRACNAIAMRMRSYLRTPHP